MPILLSLAASLLWGVADYRGGLASRAHPLLTVAAVSQAAGLAALLLAVAVHGITVSSAAVAEGAATGVLGAIAISAFYRSLAIGSMSIAAPVLATSAAIPVLAGIASGDRPSAVLAAEIAAALAGVVLASREPAGRGDAHSRAAQRRSFLLALVATLAVGGQLVLLAAAADTDPLLGVTVSRMVSLSLMLVAVLIVRPAFSRRAVPDLSLIGILDSLANLSYAAATTGAFLSVAAVLSSLYPVVTVGLAHRHLGERLAGPQRAGAALALAGAAAISAG